MQCGGWSHKAIIIIKDSSSTQPLMNSFIQSISQSAFIVSPHSQKALNSSLFQETYFCWNNSQPWLWLNILWSLGAGSGDLHISGPYPPRSRIQCFDGVLNICVQTCDTVPLCHYQVLRYHECLPPVFHSLFTNTVYSHLLADQINLIRAFFSSHKEYTSTGQTQRSPEPGIQSILSINVESWPFLPCFNQGLQETIDFAQKTLEEIFRLREGSAFQEVCQEQVFQLPLNLTQGRTS